VRPKGRLPTRQVVTEDGPHPPVELVTVADRPEPARPAGRALRVPVASVPDGPHEQQRSVGRSAELGHLAWSDYPDAPSKLVIMVRPRPAASWRSPTREVSLDREVPTR
jgi:hypothetical protein